MAGNIKGITIRFEGDTTKLDQALRKVNNETKKIDKELRQVDKALKFNPTSVELWRQKQDLLKKKIEETGKKLDALKQAQAQMDAAGVDKNSEEYRKLQREIIVTENQVKTFEGQLRKIGNVNLRATSEQFKEIGNKLTAAGQAMRAFSLAGAAAVGALGTMTYKAVSAADKLNTLSKVTGVNTRDLQKYALTAEQVDVSVEAIAKSHTRLKKNMLSAQKGTGTAAEAFDKLGVNVKNTDGSLRDADTVWQETIAALGQMENETERDAIAMQLMGKSASELNPLIEDGGETYKRVAELFEKYNLELVDQNTLDRAEQFKDGLDDIKSMGTLAFEMLGARLAEYLLPVIEKVVDVVGRIVGWLANLNPKVLAVIGAVAAVVAVIGPLLLVLGKVAFAISSIMSLMATLGISFAALAGPVGIVIAIIAALIAIGVLLYKHWDEIKAKAVELKDNIVATFNNLKLMVTQIFNNIKNTLSNIWNGIKTVITTAAQIIYSLTIGRFQLILTTAKTIFSALRSAAASAWNGIKDAMTTPIENARTLITGIIKKIKSAFPVNIGKAFNIKLPHVSVGSKPVKAGDRSVNIPTFSIDWYAKGGIFDSASLIGVGESGAEAVVPLDRFWDEIRNSNARTDQILARQNQILIAMYEELQKEKNFKVDGIWAGRYINSMVKQ